MFQKKALVLAALMASAAVAQAQVKVYGYLDLSVGSFEKAGGESITQVSSGNMMTSFLGFSGSEDLGGGLKAEFTLETFLAPDTGSTVANNYGTDSNGNATSAGFWGRGSNVALSGGFGKVVLGQYDNPLFISGLSYNPFGSSMLFSPTMRHYYSFSVGIDGGYNPALTVDTGWVNSVTYETPDMGGFTATVQWSPKETSTPGDKDSVTIGAGYNAGPLSLMVVHADIGLATGNAAYFGKQKVTSLGASYDFGMLKAFGQYTKVNNDLTTADPKIYQVGVSVPVTPMGKILASYGQEKILAFKDKIFSVAYDHSLSKRTGVYIGYTSERATGEPTANSYAAGVRHSF